MIWVNDCSGLETTGQARFRCRWTALQVYGMELVEDGVVGSPAAGALAEECRCRFLWAILFKLFSYFLAPASTLH
ncbi:hypothetical protein CSB93_6001 [Pseudomonas paraeruginosa]|uniref:Uncharacterized protein n=1 Tax=Pseudomonas paraeruginosa TaxID=2994495 RepID=A0A2R3J349_9PSED|nr:hypothetical protein CSB93_6001 [Pseudomonas paraeruginosa]AWE90628.1 hypothetical protein CSC28_4800 [Pseudomonas paraeruginosa]